MFLFKRRYIHDQSPDFKDLKIVKKNGESNSYPLPTQPSPTKLQFHQKCVFYNQRSKYNTKFMAFIILSFRHIWGEILYDQLLKLEYNKKKNSLETGIEPGDKNPRAWESDIWRSGFIQMDHLSMTSNRYNPCRENVEHTTDRHKPLRSFDNKRQAIYTSEQDWSLLASQSLVNQTILFTKIIIIQRKLRSVPSMVLEKSFTPMLYFILYRLFLKTVIDIAIVCCSNSVQV
uniref:Uncharacterized protein n=1 Tax=Timema monikensis TaxID=170555 RepID=A0A7R9E565_9NEOP|nr:unnamed protein product [Timema monikensis]